MPVRIGITAVGQNFGLWVKNAEKSMRDAVLAGLEGVAAGMQQDLRRELGEAFPRSRRAATLVSAQAYGETAVKPIAVLVFPRKGAGRMLTGHRGGTFRAGKATYLAIPQRGVPRANMDGRMRPMGPEEYRRRFGADSLTFVPAKGGGKAYGYLMAKRPKAVASGRRKGQRYDLMYVLVKDVTLRARLNPDAIVKNWVDMAPRLIEQAAQRLGART
jgi:hypothetical protein